MNRVQPAGRQASCTNNPKFLKNSANSSSSSCLYVEKAEGFEEASAAALEVFLMVSFLGDRESGASSCQ